MIPPVLFPLFTWLALLIRYPRRTLMIALPIFSGLLCIALWVQWQEKKTEALLAQVQIELRFAPQVCSADNPLHVRVFNSTDSLLGELRWQLVAQRPGEQVNLARADYNNPGYRLPRSLPAGESWESCLPLPALRPGYRADTLEFYARQLKGRFAS